MKIVYIGASDGLAKALIGRMIQEGHDVYFLADKAFPEGFSKTLFQYRFYRIPKKTESYAKLLVSIAPEGVVFAGNHYLNSLFFEESDADITLLSRTLHALENKRMRFLLLSSTEVYGDTEGKTDESGALAPRSERGIRFAREKHLFRIYREQFGLDGAALRASKIYENALWETAERFSLRPAFPSNPMRTLPPFFESKKKDEENIIRNFLL